ncbi:MAG: A/G-specific adenine glycosylase [Novosphingobium sp.]
MEASLLLDWYDANARVLPWRAPPGAPPPDPYRVWLSEVMLQQTTTAAVVPYFEAFTRRWPTVEMLATAPDAEVMAAWAGLGYYARARNLLACAREVAARGGRFPATETELRALPGLGAYTAAAVAAIAFGERAVVVDANVERVVARLFAIDLPLPAARKAICQKAEAIAPDRRPGDFAQAMMDLGATICTSRNPRCLLCPLSGTCAARRLGDVDRYPVKPAKKAKPERQGRAWWIERDGAVWLVRRPAKGMLGGMRALPGDGWSARADGSQAPPLQGHWKPAGSVQHVFTHFALDLHLALYSGGDWASLERQEGEWWPLDRIEEAGLPTLYARAARLALAQRGDV